MKLNINSVWRVHGAQVLSDGLWRLITICPITRLLVLIEIVEDRKCRRPKPVDPAKFQELLSGKLVLREEYSLPAYQLKADQDISPLHRGIRDKRLELIRGPLNDPLLAVKCALKRRSDELTRYAKAEHTSRKNLAHLLSLYWQFGQQKNSLLPAYGNCGAPGKFRQPGSKKRGRPKKHWVDAFRSHEGINIGDREREIFMKGLRKYFLRQDPLPLSETYDNIITDFYTDEIERAEIAKTAPAVPSLHQFYDWQAKLLDKAVVIKEQSSEKDYLLEKRALLSNATAHTPLPGSCFEIDATTADVHLVSKWNENHCIGRATVYALVDKASRMIVGIYVGLEYEGWSAAKQALLNCMLSKKDYCARYGIEIVEEDWPCRHLPQAMLGDRGCMLAIDLQKACVPNVTIGVTGTERADLKAIVESRFKHLKDVSWDHTDGTTKGKPLKRRDRDPKKDAKYTLYDFTQEMIEAVLEHNNRCQFDDLALSALMIENDLAPTPLNFWNIHRAKHLHALREMPENDARAMLLEPVLASVTDRGIMYQEMLYVCDEAVKEGWFVNARSNGRWKVEARISLDDSSEFYVRKDAFSPFVKCKMKSKMAILDGQHLAEVRYFHEWKRDKKDVYQFSMDDVRRKQRRQDTKRQAEAAQKAAPANKTKKEKGADIKQRRTLEIELMKGAQSPQLETQEVPKVTRLNVQRRSKEASVISMIHALAKRHGEVTDD